MNRCIHPVLRRIVCLVPVRALAEADEVRSPDGRIAVEVGSDGGGLSDSVRMDGAPDETRRPRPSSA